MRGGANPLSRSAFGPASHAARPGRWCGVAPRLGRYRHRPADGRRLPARANSRRHVPLLGLLSQGRRANSRRHVPLLGLLSQGRHTSRRGSSAPHVSVIRPAAARPRPPSRSASAPSPTGDRPLRTPLALRLGGANSCSCVRPMLLRSGLHPPPASVSIILARSRAVRGPTVGGPVPGSPARGFVPRTPWGCGRKDRNGRAAGRRPCVGERP
jgi:hypothetical protein